MLLSVAVPSQLELFAEPPRPSARATSMGNHRGAAKDRGNDLYETPPVAVEALLRVEALPPVVWDCCCGPGNITRVLRQHGHTVEASDLGNYHCEDSRAWIDFLRERQAPKGVGAIVINPPFRLSGEFVRHGLDLVRHVIILQRLNFLEGETRSDLLDAAGPLQRIHVLVPRLPRMHLHGWQGNKASASIAHAWFVFDRQNRTPAAFHHLHWRRTERDTEKGKGSKSMPVLEETTAKRLAKLFRLLGSDFDGEVLNAARRMRQQLTAEGLNFNDVAIVIENASGEIEKLKYSDDDAKKIYEQGLAEGRAAGVREPPEFYDEDGEPRWHEMALFCQRNAPRLKENELTFIDDIAARTLWHEPTEKQSRWLLSIFIRLGGRRPAS